MLSTKGEGLRQPWPEYWATPRPHFFYTFTLCQQEVSDEIDPPELQQRLAAAQGNQEAMDAFARVNAGVTPPAVFFSEENVGRIFAAAGGGQS